ncbi:MAG TPA: SGNH/GDSL hydrolase family protein [Candidatus Xenobia bacterium]
MSDVGRIAPRRPFVMTAVGDSLLSGMQDMHVDRARQDVSVPKLLADRVGIDGTMPAIRDGYKMPMLFPTSWKSTVQSLRAFVGMGVTMALPMAWARLHGTPPERLLRPLHHAVVHEKAPPSTNFALPGAKAADLLMTSTGEYLAQLHDGTGSMKFAPTVGTLMEAVLRNQGSAVDQAVKSNPDLILLWAGNNDAMQACYGGELHDGCLTPMDDRRLDIASVNPLTHHIKHHQTAEVHAGFRTSMDTIVDRLESGTHAEIVMMNIPDVTRAPFLRPLGEKIGPLPLRVVLPGGRDVTEDLENFVLPSSVAGAGKDGRTEYPPGTMVNLFTIAQKAARMCFTKGGPAFTEDEVLDPDEVQQIRERVNQYNAHLDELAASHPRLHLVDFHGMLADMDQHGRELNGAGPTERITGVWVGTQDARGDQGVMSYDGQHPANVGQALIANAILQRIQQDLGDRPGFEAFRQAHPIDEKAMLHADPRVLASPHKEG